MIMIRRSERAGGDSGARFAPGDLVRHRRYGYRGVVVEFDTECTAPESWYEANQTQPRRDQPWYHVLVDQSHAMTYAAQDSLAPDDSAAEIDHPLLAEFFEAFQAGRYVRNDRPWSS